MRLWRILWLSRRTKGRGRIFPSPLFFENLITLGATFGQRPTRSFALISTSKMAKTLFATINERERACAFRRSAISNAFSAYLGFPFPRLHPLFSSFWMTPSSNAFLAERDGDIVTISLLLLPLPSMYSCLGTLSSSPPSIRSLFLAALWRRSGFAGRSGFGPGLGRRRRGPDIDVGWVNCS